MKKKLMILLIFTVFLSGCTEENLNLKNELEILYSERDALNEDINKLTEEIDELKYGESRLIAIIETAYEEDNLSLAKQTIEDLIEKHPESTRVTEFKGLLAEIKQKELEEEEERIRLANINNTGMWTKSYYIDEFNEPTTNGYITNTEWIQGVFSNSATQDSKLNVRFLISESRKIRIKLFEYAGDNPVKAYSRDSYKVSMQDNEGNRYSLRADNYSDRLSFDEDDSLIIHNALLKGGTLKFSISEVKNNITEYKFNIEDANWYENAYKQLEE